MGYQREPRTPLSASPKVTITIQMTCIVNISLAGVVGSALGVWLACVL